MVGAGHKCLEVTVMSLQIQQLIDIQTKSNRLSMSGEHYLLSLGFYNVLWQVDNHVTNKVLFSSVGTLPWFIRCCSLVFADGCSIQVLVATTC